MKPDSEIISQARAVIEIERNALSALADVIDQRFANVVRLILQSPGKVILTGIGKSGLVARKIAATLSSTGTLAIFLHPTEGLHGDVGIVRPGDVCILLSKSGESEEMLAILPVLKRVGASTVAISANAASELATACDYFLPLGNAPEAGLAGLAPTSSTTATMALGDALAIALLTEKNFQPTDFAVLHPGGNLGKKLLLKVDDLMHTGSRNPRLPISAPLQDAVQLLTAVPLGAVSIVDDDGKLVGIFTDGDLRRAIGKHGTALFEHPLHSIITKTPTVIQSGMLAIEALERMENRPAQIMVLPVVDEHHIPVGMIRLHDLINAGLPSREKSR